MWKINDRGDVFQQYSITSHRTIDGIPEFVSPTVRQLWQLNQKNKLMAISNNEYMLEIGVNNILSHRYIDCPKT